MENIKLNNSKGRGDAIQEENEYSFRIRKLTPLE